MPFHDAGRLERRFPRLAAKRTGGPENSLDPARGTNPAGEGFRAKEPPPEANQSRPTLRFSTIPRGHAAT